MGSPENDDLRVPDEFAPDDLGPGEEDLDEPADEPLKFRDFVRLCPHCERPVAEESDFCPYCGDVLFRHLTDGVFAPRRGALTKIIAALITLLVLLALLGLLLATGLQPPAG